MTTSYFNKDKPGSDVAVSVEGDAILLGAHSPDTVRMPDNDAFGDFAGQHVRVDLTFDSACPNRKHAHVITHHALAAGDDAGAFFVAECPADGFLWYRDRT